MSAERKRLWGKRPPASKSVLAFCHEERCPWAEFEEAFRIPYREFSGRPMRLRKL
jgi:hypothetical protein